MTEALLAHRTVAGTIVAKATESHIDLHHSAVLISALILVAHLRLGNARRTKHVYAVAFASACNGTIDAAMHTQRYAAHDTFFLGMFLGITAV